MYMVIHDLKHPAESMISQLETLKEKLSQHAKFLEGLDSKYGTLMDLQQDLPLEESKSLERLQRSD